MTTKRNPATKLGEIKPCGSPWSRLRAVEGWSLAKASARANIAPTALCEIETGTRTPGLATLKKLCTLYGLTLDEGERLTRRTAAWRSRETAEPAGQNLSA